LDTTQPLVNSKSLESKDLAKIKRIQTPSLFEGFSYLIGPAMFKFIAKSMWLLQLISYIGEISQFLVWQKNTFGSLKIFLTKKKLYLSIINRFKNSHATEVLEFGVAHGYTTRLLVHEFENQGISLRRYIGFDTFIGLDQKFRNFPRGSFDNQGKFPNLVSNYLYWSKGLVQETVPKIDFDLSTRKLWIFDLDLYESTSFTVLNVLDKIQPTDVIYFDEAFDSNEFKIITEVILKTFDCIYIGTNGQGLALEVKEILDA
jgi:hypothetical protein